MRLVTILQTKTALGGENTLTLVSDGQADEIEKLFNKLWRQIYKFERRFSRFIPDSELSVFNLNAGNKTEISPEFRELLVVARQYGLETGGLYNPFIAPALQRAGYKQSALIGYEDDRQIDYTDRKVVSVERLVIGDNWASIPYGTAIDMGGCGKGYLADLLRVTLAEPFIKGYWISLGGDIATMGVDEDGNNMTVDIQDADNLGGTKDLVIDSPTGFFAVATSGVFRRKNQDMTTNWHHIIDPRSQRSAKTDVRLATVCTDSAVRADILASCAVILGSETAPEFLLEHGAKSALLQCHPDGGEAFDIVFGPHIHSKQTETFTNA